MTDSELLNHLLTGFHVERNGDVAWSYSEGYAIRHLMSPRVQAAMLERLKRPATPVVTND